MGDFCTCSLRLNQLITPVWKHFPHLETSGNLHFTMATITLRQEGGSHNFQESLPGYLATCRDLHSIEF